MLISYDSSPVNEMRNTRAGTPATRPSFQLMNGNASLSRSISVTSLSSLRLFGPDRVRVAQWSVTEVKYTFRSGHSVC
ncbi:hypothetical protein D3C78_1211110 [compost metagenome]